MTISTYRSRIEALEALADTLADRLRSANAVIERMASAQFNPAILDRIREALDEHREVRQIQEDACFNCNKPMSEHGPMAECYSERETSDRNTSPAQRGYRPDSATSLSSTAGCNE